MKLRANKTIALVRAKANRSSVFYDMHIGSIEYITKCCEKMIKQTT